VALVSAALGAIDGRDRLPSGRALRLGLPALTALAATAIHHLRAGARTPRGA
jgi:hypothetical protein